MVAQELKMTRLTDEQLDNKLAFIQNYINAQNAATGSVFDANSNVVAKNVGTLMSEMNKDIRIQIKRKLVSQYMDKDIVLKFYEQLEKHQIYVHDESQTVLPYCLAATIYPFVENGLKFLGGDSKAPRHLSSFNGGFVNLIFALSSQVAGAVATPEYLIYFDAFARLDYGPNYLTEYTTVIEQELQQVVYALNQPASARGVQSVFWNISIFDKYYFDALFKHLTFPGYLKDLKPNWDTINQLQKFFLTWFNRERTKAILTFPVVTVAMLHNGQEILDKEYEDFVCEEVPKGNAFFTYLSDTVDSLSSCCFDKTTKVLVKLKDQAVVYLSDFKRLYTVVGDQLIQIFHNGTWVDGYIRTFPEAEMYRIKLTNGYSITATTNHIHLTDSGESLTRNLTTSDYLLLNTNPLHCKSTCTYDYSIGYLKGLFIKYGEYNLSSGIKFIIPESLQSTLLKHLQIVFEQSNSLPYEYTYCKQSPTEVAITIRLELLQKSCKYHINLDKTLINTNILLTSDEVRKGFIDSLTDEQERIILSSKMSQIISVIEAVLTSLAKINKITYTNDNVIFELVDLNYHNRTQDLYFLNNSAYVRIESITPLDNDIAYCVECENQHEPYFTLPNGIITHNCRLRSDISDQVNDFQYSLGAGGVQTGSINVITLNLNRFVQDFDKSFRDKMVNTPWFDTGYASAYYMPHLLGALKQQIQLIHQYQLGFRRLFEDLINKNMMPIYTAGFIDINKQFCTIGLNGVLESAEFLGFKGDYNEEYMEYLQSIFNTIKHENKEAYKKYNIKFNTELVPAESLGVKFAHWDKKDGYATKRDCYCSYLYPVEDKTISIISKFYIHGKEVMSALDGGSANHIQLESYPTKEAYRKILNIAVQSGCNYFCTNVKVTICNECGYINKHTVQYCTKCGSRNVDYGSRVIGYLRRISNYSKDRQIEESKRYYHLNFA